MDNLKIKIKNTNLQIPIGLLVGIIVVAVGLFLMVFKGTSFMEIKDWLLNLYKEIKRVL